MQRLQKKPEINLVIKKLCIAIIQLGRPLACRKYFFTKHSDSALLAFTVGNVTQGGQMSLLKIAQTVAQSILCQN
jgi:hypothetical protein